MILLLIISGGLVHLNKSDPTIATVDLEKLYQEYIYHLASNNDIKDEELELAAGKFENHFEEFKKEVRKISLSQGYIVFDSKAVLGGGEDITNQAIELMKDIMK